MNTFGTFIDRCEDQDFLQKHLLPVLGPMQMGETEPQEIKLTEDQGNEAFWMILRLRMIWNYENKT